MLFLFACACRVCCMGVIGLEDAIGQETFLLSSFRSYDKIIIVGKLD